MSLTHSVLDKGYVRFVEAWGTGLAGATQFDELSSSGGRLVRDHECGIIEAARQSTQGSFRGWEKDHRLLETLYTNKHSTPFEFAGMVIEIQAPIIVFREWHRHRTQSYSEMSARYSPVPVAQYHPTMERLMQVNEPSTNKQAANIGGVELKAEHALKWLSMIEHSYAVADEAYRYGLAVGVAKELARCPMPVAQYSRMRASANLRNWLAFLTLRMDPLAQWEIRQYANAVGELIQETFPQTWRLFSG